MTDPDKGIPESPFRLGETPGERGAPAEVYAAAAVLIAFLAFLAFVAWLLLA